METRNRPPVRRGMSGSTLKAIALLAMVLDHAARCLIDPQLSACALPVYPQLAARAEVPALLGLYMLSWLFHALGRITFPLMLFFLSEGITHTRSIRRYAAGLLLFACLSEVPFDLAISGTACDFSKQNVFFTLFISLLAMYAIRRWHHRPLLALLLSALCAATCWLVQGDYSYWGVLMGCTMELLREKKTRAYLCTCLLATIVAPCECTALLALPAVNAYNGRRGWRVKYAFYIFYPAHLLILYIAAKALEI